MHGIVLQPDLFELVCTSRPTAKLGFVCDYIYEHSKDHEIHNQDIIIEASDKIDYYKGKVTDSVITKVKEAYYPYKEERMAFEMTDGVEPLFLPKTIYDKAIACINACDANKDFQKIMHPTGFTKDPISENELCFTMDVECDFPDRMPMVLHLKSKLDNFTIDFDSNTITVNDLKTIGSILRDFDWKNHGNMEKFHYNREMAETRSLVLKYTRLNPSNCKKLLV